MTDLQSLFSKKALSLKPSGIRRFFDLAGQMENVISLGVGEPDFKTPYAIREAGIRSLEDSKTWYTANSGLLKLRTEACEYLNRRFSLSYDGETECLITVGGSEAIDLAIRAFINPSDEVLVPEPSFVCYSPLSELAGAAVVPIPTKPENDFCLTKEELSSRITGKSKLLILPYPNNPTGAVMGRERLEEIASVLRGTDIVVLSDEVYAELTYGKKHVSIASLDGMRERTVVVNGFSKAFAMTGWRLGFAVGPKDAVKLMTKIHQFAIMCAPTTSQYAAIEALKSCDDEIEKMATSYDMRRRLVIDTLNDMGLSCFPARGAFYAFPSIAITGLSSEEFCRALLERERVAVVPGTAFGASGEGHVRISYSYSIEYLIEALKRIRRFVEGLKQ